MAARGSTAEAETAAGDPADALEPGAGMRVRMAPRQVVVAAAAGAVAAALVIVIAGAVLILGRQEDPRLVEMTTRSAALSQQVQQLTDKLRTLETESVMHGQTADGLARRLQADRSDIVSVKASLEQLAAFNRLSRDAQAGVAAPALFGVAVLQLRDGMQTGHKFDWELVNLRGIAGDDPAILAELDRLASLALTGVATNEELTNGLHALVARENLISQPSLVAAGITAVSRALGVPQPVVAATPNPQLLARASIRLAAGDFQGAVHDLAELTGRTGREGRPLLDAMRKRAAAEEAVQALLKDGRAGLQHQVRAALAAPDLVK